MAEKVKIITSDLDSSKPQEDVEKQQEAILLELKMILETVKDIDRNISKSVELLQEPTPTYFHKNGSKSQIDLNHSDLIKKNTEAISDILRMLDSL